MKPGTAQNSSAKNTLIHQRVCFPASSLLSPPPQNSNKLQYLPLQKMLAIIPKRPQDASKPSMTPNILPCKINHNGPIPITTRHWNPQPSPSSSETHVAHFRGRKLLGQKLSLPQGYTGKVLLKTETLLPRTSSAAYQVEEEEEEEEDVPLEVKQVEELANFDTVVVWGHEVLPGSENVYVQGLGEWVEFAGRASPYHSSLVDMRCVGADMNGQIHDYEKPTASTAA